MKNVVPAIILQLIFWLGLAFVCACHGCATVPREKPQARLGNTDSIARAEMYADAARKLVTALRESPAVVAIMDLIDRLEGQIIGFQNELRTIRGAVQWYDTEWHVLHDETVELKAQAAIGDTYWFGPRMHRWAAGVTISAIIGVAVFYIAHRALGGTVLGALPFTQIFRRMFGWLKGGQ